MTQENDPIMRGVCGKSGLALGLLAPPPGGRFGPGPRAGRLAAVCASGAQAWATRVLAAGDQAASRGEVRPAGATVALMTGVAHHEAEDCPQAGEGGAPSEEMSRVVRGRLHASACQGRAPFSGIGEARQRDVEGCVGTAASGQRLASPARVAVEARCVPISGRWSGQWGCCTGANRAARGRRRDVRRRQRSRVVRL
jgi:hypothetical protein